jgi:hypothetical protein
VNFNLTSVLLGLAGGLITTALVKRAIAAVTPLAKQAWSSAMGVSITSGIIVGVVVAMLTATGKPWWMTSTPTSTSTFSPPPPPPTQTNEKSESTWNIHVSGVGQRINSSVDDLGKDPEWSDVKICVYPAGTQTGGCVDLTDAVRVRNGVPVRGLPPLTAAQLHEPGVGIQATGTKNGVRYTLVDRVSTLLVNASTISNGFRLYSTSDDGFFVSVFLHAS